MSDTFLELAREYDVIRHTWCDTNGIARTKFTNSKAISGGVGMCSITVAFDARTGILMHPPITAQGCPDYMVVPDEATLAPCPWSGEKYGKKVGEVLCSMRKKDAGNPPDEKDSRYICSRVLADLQRSIGCCLMSAFEYEFVLMKDSQPVFVGRPIYSTTHFKKTEAFNFKVADRLEMAGIGYENLSIEWGSGQHEFTLPPKFGICGPDAAFRMRYCIKETAIELGLLATFMSSPTEAGFDINSGHFNFSFWKDGQNLFYDAAKPDNLSDFARYWIAGVLEHSDAIMAFGAPTQNCCRRFYAGGFAPYYKCWGIERRDCVIRVKNMNEKSTYMEFRASSSGANPYLVVAAIVAAGMDGVSKKKELQPEGYNDAARVPSSLEQSIECLQKDQVICAAMGQEFVELYCALKLKHDAPVKEIKDQIEFYLENL